MGDGVFISNPEAIYRNLADEQTKYTKIYPRWPFWAETARLAAH
jgi:hypothetical protein